ncbi:MAG: adenosylmethionine decarboxylase [Nanoarchaeota archaeon]
MEVKEVIADLFGCDPKLIDDVVYLKATLSRLAAELGTHVVEAGSHKYHPQGASVCVFVEESHLLISTWPEHGIAVFNCLLTHGPDPNDSLERLKEALGAKSINVNRFVRKWETYNHSATADITTIK